MPFARNHRSAPERGATARRFCGFGSATGMPGSVRQREERSSTEAGAGRSAVAAVAPMTASTRRLRCRPAGSSEPSGFAFGATGRRSAVRSKSNSTRPGSVTTIAPAAFFFASSPPSRCSTRRAPDAPSAPNAAAVERDPDLELRRARIGVVGRAGLRVRDPWSSRSSMLRPLVLGLASCLPPLMKPSATLVWFGAK